MVPHGWVRTMTLPLGDLKDHPCPESRFWAAWWSCTQTKLKKPAPLNVLSQWPTVTSGERPISRASGKKKPACKTYDGSSLSITFWRGVERPPAVGCSRENRKKTERSLWGSISVGGDEIPKCQLSSRRDMGRIVVRKSDWDFEILRPKERAS